MVKKVKKITADDLSSSSGILDTRLDQSIYTVYINKSLDSSSSSDSSGSDLEEVRKFKKRQKKEKKKKKKAKKAKKQADRGDGIFGSINGNKLDTMEQCIECGINAQKIPLTAKKTTKK